MSEYVCELTDADLAAWDPDVREEVVRCRDCIHFASDRLGECCTLLDFGTVGMADGFCSWGERRATLADLYGVWKEGE